MELLRKMRPVRGVLFDMDGVILDTEKLYTRFWQEAARSLGYPMTLEQALGMRSLNREAGAAQITAYFGPGADYEVIRQRRITLMDAFVEQTGVEAKPGIYTLLDTLDALGIPAAVTTSSPIDRVEQYLMPLGLFHRFQAICTGYEVPRGKPEPDIYIMGAEKLGLAPQDCLGIEDSLAGLTSADRAGCMTVLVPDQDAPTAAMRSHAAVVADSLWEVEVYLREEAERWS